MRIGIDISVLVDPNRTGIANYVYKIVKELIKNNPRDSFVLFGLTPLAAAKEFNKLDLFDFKNVERRVYRIPARLFRQVFLWWQRLGWPKIEWLIGDVDVMQSFNWWLPPQSKGRVVATVFDLTSIVHPEWHVDRTSQLDLLRFERIKKLADLAITISKSAERDFREFAPGVKTEVVYPAADERFFKQLSGQEKDKVLQKYQLEAGYWLYVGTLEPRKNLERVIKAFIEANTGRKLVLVGISGWKNSGLWSVIRKHQDQIIVTGYVADEDLPGIYQGAFGFIYASLYEGFGIPIVEAMASGVPVLSADNSSLQEVGGTASVYVSANSEEEIADGLKELSQNTRLRRKKIAGGLVQARRFSWGSSAQALMTIYRGLAK